MYNDPDEVIGPDNVRDVLGDRGTFTQVAAHPGNSGTEAWPISSKRGQVGGPDQDSPSGAKWATWDGTQPLTLQLPGDQMIRSMFLLNATPQNISIYSGAGVTGGAPLFPTGGAAGVLPIPHGHHALTLVASAPFATPISIFITNRIHAPQVALATVNVTIQAQPQFISQSDTVDMSGSSQLLYRVPDGYILYLNYFAIHSEQLVTGEYVDFAIDGGTNAIAIHRASPELPASSVPLAASCIVTNRITLQTNTNPTTVWYAFYGQLIPVPSV
jgi:hypothetical protein